MPSELFAACPGVVARAGATVEVPPDTDFVVDEGVVVSAISRPNRCFILSFAAGGDLALPFADGAMEEALRPCRLRVVSPEVRRPDRARQDRAGRRQGGL